MENVSLVRRFRGSVRLVTLHLWRIAQSTDIEEGLRTARELKMFDEENERFIRKCFALDEMLERAASGEKLEKSTADEKTASEPSMELPSITVDIVQELQMCAIRLNSADPA